MHKKSSYFPQVFAVLAFSIVFSIALIGCGRLSPHNEAAFLDRGRALLASKDYSRALLEFKNAARIAPRDAEPQYQIGLTYLNSGNYRSAIDSFHRCLELNPGHVGARLKTAELMTSSAQPEILTKAAAQLRDILEHSPENHLPENRSLESIDAVDALAFAEWRLGNREEAIERLNQLLQQFPANLSSSVMLARMKLNGNDLKGAEEVLRAASASAPQSSEAALALGEMYLVTNRTAQAEPEILRAVQLNGRNGQALLALAAMQTASKHLDAAAETYRRVSGLEDKEYRPLYALFLLQHGKQQQGIAELDRLAKQDPADRMARTRLIAALLETGKAAEAEALLSAALQRNPKDTDAHMQRGALNLRNRKVADAQRDLQQVLQYSPDNADAHRLMARTYLAQGQAQSERRELLEALKLRKELLPARLELSRNYIHAAEPKAALQLLSEAPEPQQRQLPSLIERNWALLGVNDLSSLRSGVETALQGGRYPVVLLQQALLRMATRDYAGARANAEEVLKSDPRDLRAARIIAESDLAQGQPAKALQRFIDLAKAAPASAPMQHLLGMWQLGAGNLVEARKQFEAARRADHNFTAAELALGDLDRRENNLAAARMRLRTVLEREPANTSAMLLLAEIEKSSGNHAGAIERYRAVLVIDPSNLLALNNISTELTPGNPDEALGYAQRAFDVAPDNAAVEDTLGWIYYRKGIYEMAVQHLKQAVAKGPNPRRQFHLGLSYIKLGDQKLGRELLETALRQDSSLTKISLTEISPRDAVTQR